MRRALLISIVCVIAAGCLVSAGRLTANETESIESLRKERLKAAQEWWEVQTQRDKLGVADTEIVLFYRAAKAIKDSEFDLAADKPARIRVLTTYSDRMQLLTKRAKQQFDAGNIDFNKIQELKIASIDAKARLKEEEGK